MLIEDNPFPMNMLQHEAESSTSAKGDSSGTKTGERPTGDTGNPIQVAKPLASIVVKVGNLECNANGGDTHLRTYRPKAHAVDGQWHSGSEDRRPRRAPKPAVTFSQLLAKYERLGRQERRGIHEPIANRARIQRVSTEQCPFWLFCESQRI